MRLITALFILTSTVTLAQTSATYTIPAASQGCPVGFFASRQAGLQVTTASETKQASNAQGLHLTLNHLAKPDIQKIEVTVYATSLKPRSLPLDTRPEDTISKTFELTRQTGADSLQEADVWMHEVGSIRSVDLISITYADGTTWHATPKLTCEAIPSNFVLVTSRR
ncbi:MAG: hypothetical protein WDN23_21730 [Edaphobacter sp.]